MVLCCHGIDGAILLPGLGGEIAAAQPFDRLGPEEVREHFRLAGSTVLSLGCDTGDKELAQAFLDSGAAAYIAPVDAPYGHAGLFAALYLFYELTQGRPLDAGVAKLRAHDGELAMWEFFRGGTGGSGAAN